MQEELCRLEEVAYLMSNLERLYIAFIREQSRENMQEVSQEEGKYYYLLFNAEMREILLLSITVQLLLEQVQAELWEQQQV